MILITVLVISLLLNLVLVWYLQQLVKRFLTFQENSQRLIQTVQNYLDHVGKVYELPTFYGDSTMKSLLNHTAFLREELSLLINIFDIEEETETENEEEEE